MNISRKQVLGLAKSHEANHHISTFEECISNDSPEDIKEIGIFALLYILKIKKIKYLEKAMSWGGNTDSDEDLRSKCIMSIGECYAGTKNEILIAWLVDLLLNEKDEYLRATIYIAIKSVIADSSAGIFRNGKLVDKITQSELESMEHEIYQWREHAAY